MTTMRQSAGVVLRVRDGVIVDVRGGGGPELGGSDLEWLGMAFVDAIHPEDAANFLSALPRLQHGRSLVLTCRVEGADGTYRSMRMRADAVVDGHGRTDGFIVDLHPDAETVAPTPDRPSRESVLAGLLDLGRASHRVPGEADPRRRPGPQLAVLFCTTDVVGVPGEEPGGARQEARRMVAERITDQVRADDPVASIDDGQVLVLLAGLHDAQEALQLATTIRAAAQAPIAVRGRPTPVDVTIGVALAGPHEPASHLAARAEHWARKAQAAHEGVFAIAVA